MLSEHRFHLLGNPKAKCTVALFISNTMGRMKVMKKKRLQEIDFSLISDSEIIHQLTTMTADSSEGCCLRVIRIKWCSVRKQQMTQSEYLEMLCWAQVMSYNENVGII